MVRRSMGDSPSQASAGSPLALRTLTPGRRMARVVPRTDGSAGNVDQEVKS